GAGAHRRVTTPVNPPTMERVVLRICALAATTLRGFVPSMKSRWGTFVRKGATVAALSAVVVGAGPAAPAHAGLIGGLLGTVTGVVGGVVGILTPGWDDGATTAPTPIADVTNAVG